MADCNGSGKNSLNAYEQLMGYSKESRDICENFMRKLPKMKPKQILQHHVKSKKLYKKMMKKIDNVRSSITENDEDYAYIECAYYLAKEPLEMYRYTALDLLFGIICKEYVFMNRQKPHVRGTTG